MKASKALMAILAHIPLQNRGIGLAQVDDHQAIDHIRKFAVEIEAHQLAAHLRILLQQNGQPLPILFDIGDRLGEFFQIA